MQEPVKITEKAAEKVREIMETKGIPEEYHLRIAIKGGGGCGGVNYILGFDKKMTDDKVYDISGLPVLIDKKHMMFLIGVTLDYVSENDQLGFTFYK